MINDNLGSLFSLDPNAPAAIGLRQGVVESWDPDTGENSIQVAGGTIVNIPSLTAESAEIVAGDVVALLSSGDRALVIGKVTTPGDPGTVPTWNADLTALAPLVDLAEITTGTTIAGAVVESTPVSGAYAVLNHPDYPGEIVVFSGNAGETVPARLLAVVPSGLQGQTVLRSPVLDGGALASLSLTADAVALGNDSQAQIDADEILFNTFGAGVAMEVRDTGIELNRPVTNADLTSATNIFPTEPYYNAYLNANQSIPTGAATTITGWTTDGSPSDSGITRSGGVFTVPKAGRYRLRAQVWWSAIAAPAGVRTAQWKDAALTTTYVSDTKPPNATTAHPNRAEKTVRLAAGAQVVLQVLQSQGAAVNAVGTTADLTFAQIEWVGP